MVMIIWVKGAIEIDKTDKTIKINNNNNNLDQ